MGIKDNSKINEYIEEVLSFISCKEVHEEVKLELKSHLLDTAEAYIEAGLKEDEAALMAVKNMGEAFMVGKNLDKVHKQKPEWSIILISLSFTILGLACIYFIQSSGLLGNYTNSRFIKNIISSLLGLALAIGLYFFDYRKLYLYSKHMYFSSLVALFVLLIIGKPTNGAKKFFPIGSSTINIPSIVLLILAVSLSGIFYSWSWSNKKNLIYAFLLFLAPNLLFFALPSVASVIIYSIIFTVILFTSGGKIKHFLAIISSPVALFALYLFNEPYILKRLSMSFIFNWSKDPSGMGYLNSKIYEFLHSTSLLGKGVSQQNTKIPMLDSDLILTYITYTFGWIVALALTVLILIFILKLINISKVVSEGYGKLIINSLATLFSVQFLWNILMTLGVLPIMSIPLPFISYGNTNLVINMAAIGFISSIYRRKNLKNKVLLAK